MADNTAAAPSDSKPSVAVNPDRVGEELADDANIWHVYDRVAREDDERRTKAWDTGLNNLALFAGLFSAVTTAFLIEARHDMEPDYAQLTFLAANATSYGEKFVQSPFVIPTNARTVTCLWVASLILSLSAALIAIMGKDWIGMYTARPVCNLRQWAEMRTYRVRCVERWRMSGVIATAPVLLHISLILFGVGLVLFISSDPLIYRLTLGLSLAAGGLYLVTTLSAVLFSASPFKSPATQMARAALSALYSYIFTVIYRQRHNSLRTLVGEIHAMVLRRADGTAFLPGATPENAQWHAGPHQAVVREFKAAIVYTRTIPAWARNLQWSRVRSWLHSTVSSTRQLSFDWFLSSTWTDLPVDRRPELLAEALFWLSSASQAPDVFRAIVFALGDLDIGPVVGKYTSLALRTRLRAEVRRTWQQVDFLTLSRYVLADRNTPGGPMLNYMQFDRRFNILKESSLRCEDGLAAVIMVDPLYIIPDDLLQHSPDQVAQPRMLEFLLPHMQKMQQLSTDVLILLANQYRTHLWMTNSFNLGNLEAHLYQTLHGARRNEYATVVTVWYRCSVGDGSSDHSQVEYGGTPGAIELLTFLCCHDVIEDDTKPAAVELVMELLERLPVREHRCLAYLFGSRELWDSTWKDRNWSWWSLYNLSRRLDISCVHPFEPSSVRTLSDDGQFDLALACTMAMMLSPQSSTAELKPQWIEFLFSHLCQTPSPSVPYKDEQLDVIRLILDGAALYIIVGIPLYFRYDDDVVSWGTKILAAIISHLGRRLTDPATIRDGTQLFASLVRTEVKGPDGDPRIWDLGEWLRTHAQEIVERCPSSTSAMRDVHNALDSIYPLCEHNPKLRASWDLISYPGPPAEIVYFCDPYLDIGDFFARAEDPLPRSEV